MPNSRRHPRSRSGCRQHPILQVRAVNARPKGGHRSAGSLDTYETFPSLSTHAVRPFRAATMTVTESKGLKKGSRVYWRGDATDGGRITETSWDAVTTPWNSARGPTYHRGTRRQ